MSQLGKFIEERRTEKGLSKRQLAEKAGISHTEIHRIENGERKNPSPPLLKSMAPHLGVAYEEMLKQAGYIEEVIEHQGFTESVYRDEKGHLIDIVRRAKDMYDKDSEWANLAYRVTADLTESELEIIKAQTKTLLDQFLKIRKK